MWPFINELLRFIANLHNIIEYLTLCIYCNLKRPLALHFLLNMLSFNQTYFTVVIEKDNLIYNTLFII